MRPAGGRRGLQLPAGSGRRAPDMWLQRLTGVPLSCSYTLSCQLEPPVLQSFRSHV